MLSQTSSNSRRALRIRSNSFLHLLLLEMLPVVVVVVAVSLLRPGHWHAM